MGSEDLNERNLEGGDLSMEEDTCKVQLNLESNVHVCTIDCRGPPESEATIGDLVETRALSVGQFFELHGFL